MIFLAEGDIGKLRHFVTQAVDDFRDVIYWAEYGPNGQVRDFSKPF